MEFWQGTRRMKKIIVRGNIAYVQLDDVHWAIVDANMVWKIKPFSWHMLNNRAHSGSCGYLAQYVFRRAKYSQEIQYKNGNKLDCRLENLIPGPVRTPLWVKHL